MIASFTSESELIIPCNLTKVLSYITYSNVGFVISRSQLAGSTATKPRWRLSNMNQVYKVMHWNSVQHIQESYWSVDRYTFQFKTCICGLIETLRLSNALAQIWRAPPPENGGCILVQFVSMRLHCNTDLLICWSLYISIKWICVLLRD